MARCVLPTPGGLYLIATEERFDIANPAHLAAARAISQALAPLNDPEDTRWPSGAVAQPSGPRPDGG